MGAITDNHAISKEVRRLSLRVALLRYELREALYNKTPLGMLSDIMQEICILQVQKYALLTGHFEELPYHIKQLYNEKTTIAKR